MSDWANWRQICPASINSANAYQQAPNTFEGRSQMWANVMQQLINDPTAFYGAMNPPLQRKWSELLDLPQGA